MVLHECSHCFETFDTDKDGYFDLMSHNLSDRSIMNFTICEACGRKVLSRKLAKMKW